jgi:hypothetical protein
MKKLSLFLLVILSVTLFSCCDSKQNEQQRPASDKKVIWEHIYKTGMNLPDFCVFKIQEDNHTFIITATNKGVSTLHDPGCQCIINNLNK